MKQRRVLAIGVFDLFHVGHLRYLQQARVQGHHLTVGVTPDAVCLAVKGKSPVIPETQRLEIVRAIGWVDDVRLLPTSTEDTIAAAAWIGEWGIDHVVVGNAWFGTPRWARLLPLLADRGITVEFVPQTEGISTSDIVARIRSMGLAT